MNERRRELGLAPNGRRPKLRYEVPDGPAPDDIDTLRAEVRRLTALLTECQQENVRLVYLRMQDLRANGRIA